MKKPACLILIGTAILSFSLSCSKQPLCCVVPPHSELHVTAEKNGAGWTADPQYSAIHDDTVVISGTNFNSTIEETLNMQFIISGTGNYPLKNMQAVYYNTLGRDVITSEYDLD